MEIVYCCEDMYDNLFKSDFIRELIINGNIHYCPFCGEKIRHVIKEEVTDAINLKCSRCGNGNASVTAIGAFSFLCEKCKNELDGGK